MATLISDLITNANLRPNVKNPSGVEGARRRFIVGHAEPTADADEMIFFRLPANARVYQLDVVAGGPTTTATIENLTLYQKDDLGVFVAVAADLYEAAPVLTPFAQADARSNQSFSTGTGRAFSDIGQTVAEDAGLDPDVVDLATLGDFFVGATVTAIGDLATTAVTMACICRYTTD